MILEVTRDWAEWFQKQNLPLQFGTVHDTKTGHWWYFISTGSAEELDKHLSDFEWQVYKAREGIGIHPAD